jgi:hypothetical protein
LTIPVDQGVESAPPLACYVIRPMVNFDDMTWYVMQSYLQLDDLSGVTEQDPDPFAGLTIERLNAAMAGELGDPDIDRMVVESGQNVIVNAGQ